MLRMSRLCLSSASSPGNTAEATQSTTAFNDQKQLYSSTVSHRSCVGGQDPVLPLTRQSSTGHERACGWAHKPYPGPRGDHHLTSPSYRSLFIRGGAQTPHARRTLAPSIKRDWDVSYNEGETLCKLLTEFRGVRITPVF